MWLWILGCVLLGLALWTMVRYQRSEQVRVDQELYLSELVPRRCFLGQDHRPLWIGFVVAADRPASLDQCAASIVSLLETARCPLRLRIAILEVVPRAAQTKFDAGTWAHVNDRVNEIYEEEEVAVSGRNGDTATTLRTRTLRLPRALSERIHVYSVPLAHVKSPTAARARLWANEMRHDSELGLVALWADTRTEWMPLWDEFVLELLGDSETRMLVCPMAVAKFRNERRRQELWDAWMREGAVPSALRRSRDLEDWLPPGRSVVLDRFSASAPGVPILTSRELQPWTARFLRMTPLATAGIRQYAPTLTLDQARQTVSVTPLDLLRRDVSEETRTLQELASRPQTLAQRLAPSVHVPAIFWASEGAVSAAAGGVWKRCFELWNRPGTSYQAACAYAVHGEEAFVTELLRRSTPRLDLRAPVIGWATLCEFHTPNFDGWFRQYVLAQENGRQRARVAHDTMRTLVFASAAPAPARLALETLRLQWGLQTSDPEDEDDIRAKVGSIQAWREQVEAVLAREAHARVQTSQSAV